jgi:hypothetical protein
LRSPWSRRYRAVASSGPVPSTNRARPIQHTRDPEIVRM